MCLPESRYRLAYGVLLSRELGVQAFRDHTDPRDCEPKSLSSLQLRDCYHKLVTLARLWFFGDCAREKSS